MLCILYVILFAITLLIILRFGITLVLRGVVRGEDKPL